MFVDDQASFLRGVSVQAHRQIGPDHRAKRGVARLYPASETNTDKW
jgi:hypothetical protein